MTHLPIMHRQTFEAFILTLPAATLVRQWRDDSVAKVGGKIFCLLDRDPGEVWLKVSDLAFEMRDMEGIRPAHTLRGPDGLLFPTAARSPIWNCAPISRMHIGSLRAG